MIDRPYPNLPRNRTVEIAPGVPMEFVLVLPGSFIMGGNVSGWTGSWEEHRVNITRPYYFGRYPVTQAQWTAIMGNNPAYFKGDDSRPVEAVSMEEIVGKEDAATGFLAQVSKESGYSFRLPTEAEWEYAAKGGHLAPSLDKLDADRKTLAADLYPSYAGGEDINAAAWQVRNSGYSTVRSGYRQPNVLGIYGMSGNVEGWCQDTFDEYGTSFGRFEYESRSGISDPLQLDYSRFHVVRGGSCIDPPWDCGTADRHGWSPSNRARALGFRLVLSLGSG